MFLTGGRWHCLNIIKHTQQIMLLCARRGPSRTQSPSCTHRPTRGGHQSGSSCAAANDFQDCKMQPRLPAPRPRRILLLTHTRITLNLLYDATPDLGLERLGAAHSDRRPGRIPKRTAGLVPLPRRQRHCRAWSWAANAIIAVASMPSCSLRMATTARSPHRRETSKRAEEDSLNPAR